MATQTKEPPPPASPVTPPPESDPVAQTLALIQPWIDYVPPRQRRLGIFIFLALLAHLAAFFFIRIDTTRAELRHQPRTHVTVENAQTTSISGQKIGDEFWDRLTDPRLFLLPQETPINLAVDESSLNFASINSNLGTNELPPAAQPEDFQFTQQVLPSLDQRAEQGMTPTRQPFTYEEKPPAIADKTTWQWGSELASRQPVSVPDLPSPISDTELSPTKLRIAVASDGAVEHVLVEQSCGTLGATMARDLDQQAVMAARKIRFHSTDDSGLLWGRVTIFWHYSAKPREEVVPTPPSGV